MSIDKANRKSLADKLKDAGCEPETVALFLQLCEDGKTSDQLSLLTEHRKKLLSGLHSEQAKLDCLDYLIYQMRREQAVCLR